MEAADLSCWESRFEAFLHAAAPGDPAHGLDHVRRVVAWARRLAAAENASLAVVVPAAWLHDCVVMPKDAPGARHASAAAAECAGAFLQQAGYDAQLIPGIQHAIEAHSFSSGIVPRSAEARVVQDADRLDALGAIGLARCLAVGASLGRPLLDPSDPFAERRSVDDRRFTLDHFPAKLLRIGATMTTAAGREEAARRTQFLRGFIEELRRELPMP